MKLKTIGLFGVFVLSIVNNPDVYASNESAVIHSCSGETQDDQGKYSFKLIVHSISSSGADSGRMEIQRSGRSTLWYKRIIIADKSAFRPTTSAPLYECSEPMPSGGSYRFRVFQGFTQTDYEIINGSSASFQYALFPIKEF